MFKVGDTVYTVTYLQETYEGATFPSLYLIKGTVTSLDFHDLGGADPSEVDEPVLTIYCPKYKINVSASSNHVHSSADEALNLFLSTARLRVSRLKEIPGAEESCALAKREVQWGEYHLALFGGDST